MSAEENGGPDNEDNESLLDTQDNTEASQDQLSEGPESQAMNEKEPWGRLLKKKFLRRRLGTTGNRKTVQQDEATNFFDIMGNEFYFGRDKAKCQYVFTKDECKDGKSFNRISKVHFALLKNQSRYDSPSLIQDLSSNGTFLNNELIGRNQTRLIRDGDQIAIVMAEMKVFEFKDLMIHEYKYLPDELQKKYFLDLKLGSGAFGVVYKLLDRELNPYAVKYIKCNDTPKMETIKRLTNNEIEIMKKLKHVCIIDTIEVVHDNRGGTWLVLEYMDGGDLLHRIRKSPEERLDEEQARFIFYQVTEAINYLHGQRITHRDIKPDNVLLKDQGQWPLVKLSDFGMSKIVNEGSVMRTFLGTPNYCAPEILRPPSNISERISYTNMVDVWSMGVMLFAMLSGTLPFIDNNGNMRKHIMNGYFQFLGEFWRDVSQDARRLIRNMLIVNPEERIKVHDIFETNWMNSEHEGVIIAKKIMEENGGIVQLPRKGKKHQTDCPTPPAKRTRY